MPVHCQGMYFMLLRQCWDEVFGNAPEAGLTANVAAIEDLRHGEEKTVTILFVIPQVAHVADPLARVASVFFQLHPGKIGPVGRAESGGLFGSQQSLQFVMRAFLEAVVHPRRQSSTSTISASSHGHFASDHAAQVVGFQVNAHGLRMNGVPAYTGTVAACCLAYSTLHRHRARQAQRCPGRGTLPMGTHPLEA